MARWPMGTFNNGWRCFFTRRYGPVPPQHRGGALQQVQLGTFHVEMAEGEALSRPRAIEAIEEAVEAVDPKGSRRRPIGHGWPLVDAREHAAGLRAT